MPGSCRLPSTSRLDAPPKSEAILLPRYASRYAKPLAMGALSERPPFAASGTACPRGSLAMPLKAIGRPGWERKILFCMRGAGSQNVGARSQEHPSIFL